MTDTAPRCFDCNKVLHREDKFCPQCGTPTPMNVDPDATVVDAVGSTDAKPSKSRTTGEIRESMEMAELPPGATFNERLRHVLGTEYELYSMIGQGGFARVYKARDRRLDRVVAIKVIRPDVVGNEMYFESFRNEGVALAKLRHPGIIPIYDIRERGGLIYYIMPFVQGTTLEERLERSRLPPFETRRILSELTDALSAAHREKMVHLDIKPENVFLEGDLQKVLLMDFGIAVAITEQIDESSSGPVVGTPDYMSPEQARGLPDIDHRSDIYSLGALGYRMLMGRAPFIGKNADEILQKHVKEEPVPIRDINPTIPKDFADAIMKCLEKDPWERFSNAKQLGSALESVTFLASKSEPTPAKSASGENVIVVALIACVTFLVGVLAGWAIS